MRAVNFEWMDFGLASDHKQRNNKEFTKKTMFEVPAEFFNHHF